MTSEENKERAIIKDDEIDLIALVKTIWDGRKIIYYSVGVCVFIGLIIAFTSPVKYTASATLLPSENTEGNGLGGLGGIAGMAGINLGSIMAVNNGIDPKLYPHITESLPFLLELEQKKIQWKNGIELNYKECENLKLRNTSLSSQIKKYTIELPNTIRSFMVKSTKNRVKSIVNTKGYYQLPIKDLNRLNKLSESIDVYYEKSSGLITLEMTLNDPVAIAELTQEAVDLLQKYVIEYKVRKISENLKFLEGNACAKRAEYEDVQKRLLKYRDTNRSVISERIDIGYQRLIDEYEMINSIYKNLLMQVEKTKIALNEQTPVFSVLKPVVTPVAKNSPKRKLILFVMIIFGGSLGICVIYLVKYIRKKNVIFKNRFINEIFGKLMFLSGI